MHIGLDVDGSGEISLDELLYAVAGRYMADTGPGTKEPAEAWRQAITGPCQSANQIARSYPTHCLIYTGLSEALAELEAQGRPMDAKAFRKAQKSSQDLQEGHSTGNKSMQYVKALLCPCTICCSTRGQAIGKSSKNKLIGMTAVMDYVISCKNAPAQYHYSIQNYHYETHTYRDSDGNTQTRRERVNTHFARTGGDLVSTDSTPPFQPNVVKQSVAMRCKVDVSLDGNFQQEYDHRKHGFYASNTTDSHQDHREWFTLGPMKPAVHVAWVAQEDPWYANGCVRNLAALTPLTAPCWLKAMNSYMGKQTVTFQKTCSGFAAPQRTPKNLRDIAAGR